MQQRGANLSATIIDLDRERERRRVDQVRYFLLAAIALALIVAAR